MKIKKTVLIFLIAFSIINICFLLVGYRRQLAFGGYSLNGNTVVVLLLQLLNLILIRIVWKYLNKKILIIITIIIIIIININVFFIPVTVSSSLKYKESTNLLFGKTTIITSHKNLYGVTLESNRKTGLGKVVF